MLDLKAETPLTLTQAARLVPLTRLDRPAPVRTILRWARHGVRGVQLEAVRIGGRWITSREALDRFTSTLTDRGRGANGNVMRSAPDDRGAGNVRSWCRKRRPLVMRPTAHDGRSKKPRRPRRCRCRVRWAIVLAMPKGHAHWGQLICERGRKPLRWLPEPRTPAEVPDEGHDGPTQLVGSEKQIAWAEAIRDRMKDRIDRIRAATWFIAHKDAFSRRRRPTPAEVAAGTDPATDPADGDAATGD